MAGYYYKFGKCWEVEKLWEATKDNPTEDVNVEAFMNEGMQMYWNIGTFKQLAEEMKLVLNADYSYPIIFDEEDCIVDGAHRLVHAYIDGVKTIKGVIITNNQWPEPDYDEAKAAEQYHPHWIPVEERLPDEGQEVFAWNGTFKESYKCIYHDGLFEDYLGELGKGAVSHWMEIVPQRKEE